VAAHGEASRFRVLACPATGGAGPAVVLVVAGTLAGPDCSLADRVAELLAVGVDDVVVDVARVEGADLGTVAALARLQVRMRGRGASMRLRGVSSELRAVLMMMGLDGALRLEGDG
jgi:ABC-type transporter Mla MlaB component